MCTMRLVFLIIFAFFCSLGSLNAELIPPELQEAVIQDKVGHHINLQLKFTDENGHMQLLSHFFQHGKPVILALVYYSCPNLCNFLLNGLTDALKKLKWQ